MQTPQPTFKQLTQRTADEIASHRRVLGTTEYALDLREFIASRIPNFRQPDQEALAAFAKVNESVRQRSGETALGTWLPLAGLTRDLTATTASSLVTGTKGSDAAGGLLPASAVLGGGATVLSGLRGTDYSIPTVGADLDIAGGWIDEGESIPAIDPSFGLASLTPKVLAVQVVVSRRLLMNATVDVDALIRRELALRIGHAIDLAAINGDGVKQPLGLLRASDLDVIAAGTNGLAPTYAHVVDAEYRVATRAGADGQRFSWLMSPKLAKRLRTTSRLSGQDGFILEGLDLLGYPVRLSPQVPDNLTKGTADGVCSALLFGDMTEIVVGFWGPAAVDVLVDGVTLAKDAKVRIIARAMVGVTPRRIGSFAAFKDLLAA
ncbi:phage major capsid protein [Ramlibacter sp. AW1]|uniref:Phage major capsid protein n=1 Tax=Ramlibacter aurantiacus TaxID=2801330 RepID=A0A937D4D8_9BURK|nr:phage major capsid protein [Ramlibacter aurantiacus]MBL0420232.1 phage major capsid protein [Ramlibacter aurantiacus]